MDEQSWGSPQAQRAWGPRFSCFPCPLCPQELRAVHDCESPPEPAPKTPPQSYLSQGNAASTTPGPAPVFYLMEIPTLSL